MAGLIYTPSAASIPKFLRHIHTAGVPEKMTQAYLVSTGFKTKNDRALIGIMKALGFISTSGKPTARWADFRDKSRSKQVLGQAIKGAYSDLFATYPDADRKDTEAIRNFLSSKTKVAESTLKLAVLTFKTLAAEATFDGSDARASAPPDVSIGGETVMATAPLIDTRVGSLGTAVTINIELHLPETDDADVYEKLFAALRKHLM